ncbi:MAG TPA: hypothetical protein VJ204_01465, partial [Solirubrobacterales bacterium]|nr:hypothetical protein [Solirubrobacterales bacterium]
DSGCYCASHGAIMYFNSITEATAELGVNIAGPGAPHAITGSAESPVASEERIYGQVNANQIPTTYRVEYGEGGLFEQSPVKSGLTGQGYTPINFLIPVQPGASYEYRISATNSYGTDYGEVHTFQAEGLGPVAGGVGVTPGKGSMTFFASVNGTGSDLHAHFKWGMAPNQLTHQTPDVDAGTGLYEFKQQVPEVEGTIYWNFVATNAFGTLEFEPGLHAFIPGKPAITAEGATQVEENTAELRAWINPETSETKAFFEYGPTAAYGNKTPEVNVGAGGALIEASRGITKLQPQTVYHFRVVATNAVGTRLGPDLTFETGGRVAAELTDLAITDPFNATSDAISNFTSDWTAVPWAGGTHPKGGDSSNGWGPSDSFPLVAGASYGPSVADLGTGLAVEATMAANPGGIEHYFSVWLDLPNASTSKAGYQLKFYESGTNTYTVSLLRWIGGTSRLLKEAKNVALSNGNLFALVDEGSVVSVLINTGSAFKPLIAASDGTYSSGTVAVEGSGSATRITNLKFGLLAHKVTNMSTALGEVRLDDAFATAESPLSEAGIWAPLAWDYQSVHKTGSVSSPDEEEEEAGGWGAVDAFASGIDGAYWTKASFADTGSGDAVAATISTPQGNTGRYFDLLLDMQNPATARSGYELSLVETKTNNIENIALEKRVAGVATVLATKTALSVPVGSRFALADKGGTLSVWMAAPTGGFTQLLSAADSTYTNGYVGVAAGGNLGTLTNFRGGPLAPF